MSLILSRRKDMQAIVYQSYLQAQKHGLLSPLALAGEAIAIGGALAHCSQSFNGWISKKFLSISHSLGIPDENAAQLLNGVKLNFNFISCSVVNSIVFCILLPNSKNILSSDTRNIIDLLKTIPEGQKGAFLTNAAINGLSKGLKAIPLLTLISITYALVKGLLICAPLIAIAAGQMMGANVLKSSLWIPLASHTLLAVSILSERIIQNWGNYYRLACNTRAIITSIGTMLIWSQGDYTPMKHP